MHTLCVYTTRVPYMTLYYYRYTSIYTNPTYIHHFLPSTRVLPICIRERPEHFFLFSLFFSIFFVSCCFVWACANQFRRPTKTHDSMYGLNQRPFDSIRNRPTLPEPKPTRGRILLEAIYLATSIWSNQIPMIPIRHCLGNKYQGVQWFPINLKAYCTKKYFAPPVAMVSRDVCGCCF